MFYNNPQHQSVRLNDVIGGCFPLSKCACGCRFCMGDILRKLQYGMVAAYDRYFFVRHATGVLAFDSDRVKRANEYCKTRVEKDSDVPRLLDHLFRGDTNVLSVAEIRELYASLPLKNVWPANYLQCSQ